MAQNEYPLQQSAIQQVISNITIIQEVHLSIASSLHQIAKTIGP